MIFLTNEHIQEVLDMKSCLSAMEEAYRNLAEDQALRAGSAFLPSE